jgi:hypothetical protein
LTVGFNEYHTHFGWHEGNPHHDVADAVAFVAELLMDRSNWLLGTKKRNMPVRLCGKWARKSSHQLGCSNGDGASSGWK